MNFFNKPTQELPAVMRPIPCKDSSRMEFTPLLRGACVAYLGDHSFGMTDWELFRNIESHFPGGYVAFEKECEDLEVSW